LLSGGLATHQITRKETEYASQVFIAIDISKFNSQSAITKLVGNILNDYQQSVAADNNKKIVYPGQRVLETRKRNLENGIPVLKEVWQAILKL
jgi:3-dehydro-L-gulonate 2-dehydrogenase